MKATTTITIQDLIAGDRIDYHPLPPLTVAKVWEYNDGSVTIEMKGLNPGLWRYADNDLATPVDVLLPRPCRKVES